MFFFFVSSQLIICLNLLLLRQALAEDRFQVKIISKSVLQQMSPKRRFKPRAFTSRRVSVASKLCDDKTLIVVFEKSTEKAFTSLLVC